MAPLYLAVRGLPVKSSLGTSLAASAMLAIPGTVVHPAVGHINWLVVAAFAIGSVLVLLGGTFLLIG